MYKSLQLFENSQRLSTKLSKGEIEALEKRLDARYFNAKEAEKKAKEAKDALIEAKKPKSDVDAIVEVQQATDGLDPTEIGELKS